VRVCVLRAVFSARDQNQVLKEVDLQRKSLDDLYYDAFSGQSCHATFDEILMLLSGGCMSS